MLVTIDGPAGSGKSSVAQAVADRLGFTNLNTGAAYRAVAFLALREGVRTDEKKALAELSERVSLGDLGVEVDGARVPESDLRSPEVSAAASEVSVHPEVREVLLSVQRRAAEEISDKNGAVVEGRDIGTVVLPHADLKVFLSADPEERARRRAAQSGREKELERIREAMSRRDRQDTEREVAPLKPAPDAEVIDTTGLALEEVVSNVISSVEKVRSSKSQIKKRETT